jgi:hypothetical protein
MQGMAPENKLRLLLIYVATHPEKLDTAKRLQWMKVITYSIEPPASFCNKRKD